MRQLVRQVIKSSKRDRNVEKYVKGTNLCWEVFFAVEVYDYNAITSFPFRFQYFGDSFDKVSQWKKYVFYHEIEFLQKNILLETLKLKLPGIRKISLKWCTVFFKD